MTTQTQKIEWTTGSGQAAAVVVELTTEQTINADGHLVTVRRTELAITATVDGQILGIGRPVAIRHPIAVSRIGQLAMVAANHDRVMAAIAELEATPEWQAEMARKAEIAKQAREYETHRAMMRGIMGY